MKQIGIFSCIVSCVFTAFTSAAAPGAVSYTETAASEIIAESIETESMAQEEKLGFICEGTKWECIGGTFIPGVFEWTFYNVTQWIEGTEVIDGTTYMKAWSSSDRDENESRYLTYIRTEGKKVYMLDPSDPEATERLVFDFAVQPGEVACVTNVMEGSAMNIDIPMVCIGTENEVNCGNTYNRLRLEVRFDQSLTYPIYWIEGIGSDGGLLDNILNNQMGGMYLKSVYHDGELVYENNTSGIEEIKIQAANRNGDGRTYDMMGREVKAMQPGGVYIRNGRKFIGK